MPTDRLSDERLAELRDRFEREPFRLSVYEVAAILAALQDERAEVKRLEHQWAERKCSHDRLNEYGVCCRCGAWIEVVI